MVGKPPLGLAGESLKVPPLPPKPLGGRVPVGGNELLGVEPEPVGGKVLPPGNVGIDGG